ncbi:hypothetical protein N7486_008094 [Penicillium sp. IBT 16267x]|nr:hypothetical protein N7486_008094 [Penicillium sp. IBT 16267x]
MAAIAGLGCVAHDWVDLGADVLCGEVSNIIPSLTRGSLEEEPLAEVYSRLIGAIIWYRNNDPYNPAALCLLFTHWWQLSNCRHRPVTLLGRTDIGVEAAIAPTMPDGRPELEHFRVNALVSGDILPETRAVIEHLVNPVIAYVKGGDSLPAESEYIGTVLAAEVAYPTDRRSWSYGILPSLCGSVELCGQLVWLVFATRTLGRPTDRIV